MAQTVQNTRAALARVFSDRRGATAAAFGIMATVVVGMAGLATEAGRWYDIRRDAQNAADAAALAGAVRLQYAYGALNSSFSNSQTQGIAAATDVATRNGFTNATSSNTVTVNSPPATGSYTGNNRAVEVRIWRNQPRFISGLFAAAGSTTQEIYARGVAASQVIGSACVLALSDATGQGGITLSGNSSTYAPGCVLASNAPGSDSIYFNGNSTNVIVSNLQSLGGCMNNNSACSYNQTCTAASNTISLCNGPPVSGIATDDPYLAYQSILSNSSPSAITSSTSFSQPGNNVNSALTLSPVTDSGWVYQGTQYPYYLITTSVNVKNGGTLLLKPGTYFFMNGAGLDVSGTVCAVPASYALTTCPSVGSISSTVGVTLVFLRGCSGQTCTAGTMSVSGTAQLQAPTTGPYRGMLIYREGKTVNGVASTELSGNRTSGSCSNMQVCWGANSTSRLTGAIYAPLATIGAGGNGTSTSASSVSAQGCLTLVGGEVRMQGVSSVTTNCESNFGSTIAPQIRVVRLLE
ncbi:pilus assembly protein TadG-related protein [Falsiroseomonas sp. HW251]|uniref:pilus assembly protein TadG-related protein n=1 Tax=Falsiroseomonas sp. HW251 TaxID=3390998 RepID=UPI003D314B04